MGSIYNFLGRASQKQRTEKGKGRRQNPAPLRTTKPTLQFEGERFRQNSTRASLPNNVLPISLPSVPSLIPPFWSRWTLWAGQLSPSHNEFALSLPLPPCVWSTPLRPFGYKQNRSLSTNNIFYLKGNKKT